MSAQHAQVVVPPELDGERLDKILAALVPALSRHLARKILAMGGVHLSRPGRPRRRIRRASEPLHAGDLLEATWHPDVLAPERFELVVLHEDEDIVVVAKPAGQLSQGSELGDVGSLIHALTRRYGPELRLMHRLDKGTSGVMLAAKSPFASQALTPQLREHTIERRYLAITSGVPPEGPCEVPIVHAGRRVRAGRPDEPGALPARSVIHLRQVFGSPESPRALVEVELFTGRTHQIRIHLQHLGAPILGDLEHGGPPAPRLYLHAAILGFTHPRGHPLRFERAPPDDFALGPDGPALT